MQPRLQRTSRVRSPDARTSRVSSPQNDVPLEATYTPSAKRAKWHFIIACRPTAQNVTPGVLPLLRVATAARYYRHAPRHCTARHHCRATSLRRLAIATLRYCPARCHCHAPRHCCVLPLSRATPLPPLLRVVIATRHVLHVTAARCHCHVPRHHTSLLRAAIATRHVTMPPCHCHATLLHDTSPRHVAASRRVTAP